jgi:hypothetical protein
MKNYQSNMKDTDYSLQKVKMKISSETLPKNIQTKIIEYLNNLPNVKHEQQAKLEALTNLENNLKRNLQNIDSLLVSRVVANKNATTSVPGDQTMVNAATRSNVEADLLNYTDRFNVRLFGTMMTKSDVEKGIQIVSNLRSVGNEGLFSRAWLKFAVYGFVLASFLILLIEFNKYLDRYKQKKAH